MQAISNLAEQAISNLAEQATSNSAMQATSNSAMQATSNSTVTAFFQEGAFSLENAFAAGSQPAFDRVF